jgi:hypothetical protein
MDCWSDGVREMPPSQMLRDSAAPVLSSGFDRDDQKQKKDRDDNHFVHTDLHKCDGFGGGIYNRVEVSTIQ